MCSYDVPSNNIILSLTVANDIRLTWNRTSEDECTNMFQCFKRGHFFGKWELKNWCHCLFSSNEQYNLVWIVTCPDQHYANAKPNQWRWMYSTCFTESHPVCNVSYNSSELTTEDDVIQLQCTMTFKGNWVPVGVWNRSDGKMVNDSTDMITSNGTFTSIVNLNVTSAMNGVSFTSGLRWLWEHRPEPFNSSNNIPEFNFSWTSEPLHVMSECFVQMFISGIQQTSLIHCTPSTSVQIF